MTQDELNAILDADAYSQERKKPTEFEVRAYLREVDYHCPLCGKELQSRKQRKQNRLFEIAHIYPNRPTVEQYQVLFPLGRRLGSDSESYENKIALCKDCHDTQDYHTTAEDYLRLYNIKSHILAQNALTDISEMVVVEEQISLVIDGITKLTAEDVAELRYSPVPVANKFTASEFLLRNKVMSYVLSYYSYIKSEFQNMDGKDGFHMQILSEQVRSCFIKMSDQTQDKTMLFDHIVTWIKNKTCSTNGIACEAVAAFFVQNCEVFYEITE